MADWKFFHKSLYTILSVALDPGHQLYTIHVHVDDFLLKISAWQESLAGRRLKPQGFERFHINPKLVIISSHYN